MTPWRSSAALRLSIGYSLCLAAGTIALGSAMFWTMHHAFQQQIDAELADEVARLAGDHARGGLGELVEAIGTRGAVDRGDQLLYALYDAHGTRLAGTFPGPAPAPGLSDVTFTDPVEGPDRARVLARPLPGTLRLAVAADSERIERIDHTMIAAFAAALAGVVVLGVAGAFLFARLLRERLGRLAERAGAITAGEVSGRMPVSPRGDEFDALATSLNQMLARIEELVVNLRQVSGAVAHDLRTPLARLRQRLERAAERPRDPDDAADFAAALAELDEVLALFRAILHVSEVESGAELPVARVDLSALVLELAESYEPSVRQDGRRLAWQVTPGLTVTGSRTLLAQALSNLVENAIRHTPPGSTISVRLAARDGVTALSVADDGPGIAAADRARALLRFERLDPSRSSPGFGLGLTLVDAVARRHGGRLDLGDADPAPGLVATMSLPLGPQQASQP